MPICTSAGARIVLKPAEPLPPSPEVAMPTKSELLIITSTEHMCDAELARLTDKARLVEWLQEEAQTELKSSEIGDGLCRCSESRNAYWSHVLHGHATPLKVGLLSGRFVPTAAQRAAMHLVAGLVNDGAVALVDDQYAPGQRRFRALRIGKGADQASAQDMLIKIEATTAQLADELKPSVSPVMVPGELAAFPLGPLAMAISDTAGLLADATGKTAERLDKHLAQLLDIQLNRVAAHE